MADGAGLVGGWVERWRNRPDDVVLVEEPSGDRWTGGRLDQETAAMAARLQHRGIAPGTAVALSAGPSAATVTAFVAVLRAGGVVVPLNTAATARELAHAVDVSGAVLAVADEPGRFDGIAPSVTPGTLRAESAARSVADGRAALDRAAASDPALVCFTSGTTGVPKGAPLSHGNVHAGCRALIQAWRWTPGDVLVSALPLFHVHGLLVALSTSLTVGGRIVVLPRFSPESIVEAVEVHAASMVFGVPTMWSRMADAGVLSRLTRLRCAVSGSAPLSTSLFDRIAAETGSPPVERYGMTETMIISTTPVDGARHSGTVGHALPGMSVRIAHDGVVEVRGPSVFAGYLGRDRDDEFTPDGWFRTGDIGEYDDDGCLRLVGRASELIITGGYNVYPREVEDVLLSDAAVADAAVVGAPDETWGELVVASVVLVSDDIVDRPAVTATPAAIESVDTVLTRLEKRCAAELSPYKRPRRWHVAESLPRNAMGKVDRDALRRSLLA